MREETGKVRERAARAVRASPTAVLTPKLKRQLLIATLAGLFLALTGPFNTGSAPLPVRLAYWLLLMWTGAALGAAISAGLRRSAAFEARPIVVALALAAAIALPMTLVVWVATHLAFAMPLSGALLAWFFGPVLLISLAMTTINTFTQRRPAETHAAAADAEPARFLDRLPFGLKGAELYAVEAEDHYLRLHTSRGSDLILMRLSDAIAELDGIEGARTHRSWWVAKQGVAGARTADGRALLTLKSGVEAPVSRTYVKTLREERWW